MHYLVNLHHRLATDIVQGRLEMAQKMGADVLINGKVEDLKSRGWYCSALL